jgi:hypothetical protein
MRENSAIAFPKPWTITGYILLAMAAVFVGGIVYQETILTWTNGPQGLGFGNVHTGTAIFFFLAAFIVLVGTSVWMIGSLVLLFRRKFRTTNVDWAPIILLITLVLMLFIPYDRWEELTVRIAGPGPRGSDLMLHAAVQGNQRLVAYFVRKGYDINYENDGGATPLSAASVGGDSRMVGFLISEGADVNRKDRLIGETPLMAASEMGKLETVSALLRSGADPCATNKQGHTAEGLARAYRHSDIADYLSTRYSCEEKVIDSCTDPAVSVCVHP